MRYTFKQLEYFVAVADTGSIAAAAERIHISAPAISAAIAQLEQELQVSLFVRQSVGLQLTSSGQWALERARKLLQDAQGLYGHASGCTGELRGKVSVGCLTTLAPLMLPEICQGFTAAHPSVDLELIDGTQDQLIGHLRRGVIDLAVTYEMHIPPDLLFETLVSLSPLMMMSAVHRMASDVSVDLHELAQDKYILLDLPFSRDYFLSVFEHVHVAPNIHFRTTHFEVLRTMVANNQGISITVSRPRNEAALDGKLIISRPISNALPKLSIGVLSRLPELSTPAGALKRHVQTVVNENYVPGMRPLD
jgi:DNA-binding transcriptional LysR family regulator